MQPYVSARRSPADCECAWSESPIQSRRQNRSTRVMTRSRRRPNCEHSRSGSRAINHLLQMQNLAARSPTRCPSVLAHPPLWKHAAQACTTAKALCGDPREASSTTSNDAATYDAELRTVFVQRQPAARASTRVVPIMMRSSNQ